MKIKTKISTTKEVEIDVPEYFKSQCHYYFRESEETCIQVYPGHPVQQIQRVHMSVALCGDITPITKEQYREVLCRTFASMAVFHCPELEAIAY